MMRLLYLEIYSIYDCGYKIRFFSFLLWFGKGFIRFYYFLSFLEEGVYFFFVILVVYGLVIKFFCVYVNNFF